jgi:hypothetical protein
VTRERELIIGWDEIARFVGLSVSDTQVRADRGDLPIHKIGGEIVATPTGLRQWRELRSEHPSR